MAVPVYVASDKVFTTSTTVTVPVPAGVLNGDSLVMYIDPIVGGTTTTPAGWTLLGTNSSGRAVMWRTAASEPASYNVTVSYTTTAAACGIMTAWRDFPTAWLTSASHTTTLDSSERIDGTQYKARSLHFLQTINQRVVNKKWYTELSFVRYRNTAAAAALTYTVGGGGVKQEQYDDITTIAAQGFGVAVCSVTLPHRMHAGNSAYAHIGNNLSTSTGTVVHTYGTDSGVDDIFPVVVEDWDVLSTVATIDHDILIGVEPDQHHAESHGLDETVHSGGLFYKAAVSPTVSDTDFTAPEDGMVAVSYDTSTGLVLYWVRSFGSWKSVEA